VKRLYVKPEFRKRGLARALLNSLESWAAASGYDELYLDSKADLVAAIAFYEEAGYQRCGRYNDNPQATVFMRKGLNTATIAKPSI
jgi:GNAT superfamily N-acetyltransferase